MAMIFYDRLYRQKGIRRQAHLIKPRVLDATEFVYPLSSVMYWWKGNETNSFLTKSIPYFNKVDRGVVSSIIGYTHEDEIFGKVVKRTIQPNMWIKESADRCKEFKFLKINQPFKITPKVLKIMNLGVVSSKYKYPIQILKRHNVYKNVFRTVLESLFLESSERNIFVNIDLPKELPTRILLNKYATRLLNGHLDQLPTYEYFNLIEFWKFLTPELASESLIHKYIPKEQWNKVNLLFSIDNKVVMIRLSILASLVKDYGVAEAGFKPREADMARKIFYRFLENIISTAAMSDTELEHLENEIDNPTIEVRKGQVEGQYVRNNPDDIEGSILDDNEADAEKALNENIDSDIEDDYIEEEPEIDPSAMDESDSALDIEENEGNVEDSLILGQGTENTDELDLEYESLDQLLAEGSEYDNVYKQLDKLLDAQAISKKEYEANYQILSEQPKRLDPYGTGKQLVEVLDSSLDKVQMSQEDFAVTDNVVVFDKSLNKNVIGNITKNYIDNQFHKDIVRSIYAMQNGNIIIKDYTVHQSESILGGLEEHYITIKPLLGKPQDIKIVIPKIENDGTFKVSNQTYTMRSQRADNVLRKISPTRVALSSYYGKFFIEKASFKRNDAGYFLFNNIAKMYQEGKVTDLVAMPAPTQDTELPVDYSHMSRYMKMFKFKDYSFVLDYKKRNESYPGSIVEFEKGGAFVFIGTKGKQPIVMEKATNKIHIVENGGKKFSEVGTIYEILNLSRIKQPVEYADIKIYSARVPVVCVLSYYIGLEQLLKLLGATYEKYEPRKLIRDHEDWYIIRFKDIKLRVKKDYGVNDMILGGFANLEKITKDIQYKVVNTRSSFQILWNKLGYHLTHTNEIKLMENLFVDPITLDLCKSLGLPTNLKGLMIEACKILVDDNYKNPNDISGMLIKGYERVAGMVYNELIKATREYESKNIFSKYKMVVNPYSIIQAMNEDSATTLVDDLNPMASLKQCEDVTYLGSLGRNKISMSKGTREYNTSEIGIISEATKDSSDVGITAYLTSAPSIDNIRGKTNPVDINQDGWGGLLSSSSMLAPFSINDDSKRANFSSIMNSHVIPINKMRVPYVRTGYESVLPVRFNKKFCISAEEDGKVLTVTKNEITVEYINKGKQKYKLKSWTSKEEAGACYEHTIVTSLKPGDKFIKDDTITYDQAFFEPDIFNPKRVVYKQGDVVTVALMEDKETFEDSAGIHKRLSDRLGTTVTKIKSIRLSKDENIVNLVKTGQHVEPSDILLTITDPIFVNDKKVDEETLAILQNFKNISPKAKVRGTISKIELRYNCEKDEMSESLRELANISDKSLIEQYGYPGKVNGSYSIEGVPLMNGEVQIKIYINTGDNMGIGDKAIFGNQLKFTVGEVFDYDIATEDGTEIDATFGLTSIMARIVCSPLNMGTLGMCIEKLEEKAIEMYFGKK